MEMARCIIENGRAELIQTYPNPLYEGETADPANQSDYPSIFDEPLTFELFTAHQAPPRHMTSGSSIFRPSWVSQTRSSSALYQPFNLRSLPV